MICYEPYEKQMTKFTLLRRFFSWYVPHTQFSQAPSHPRPYAEEQQELLPYRVLTAEFTLRKALGSSAQDKQPCQDRQNGPLERQAFL